MVNDPVAKRQETLSSQEALQAHEDILINQRRKLAGAVDQPGHVGLALSGGGVRSATFCLGVLRALANQKLLGRFDYLSTVSGGGYAGSAFGRMFSKDATPQQVQSALTQGDSLLLWWLRRNGRFLMPAGREDLWLAIATFLRALVAVHVEFAAFALLLGLVVTVPHLIHYTTMLPTTPGDPVWHTLWWPLALAPLFVLLPGSLLSYWFARGRFAALTVARNLVIIGLLVMIALVCGWYALGNPSEPAQVQKSGLINTLIADWGSTVIFASLAIGAFFGFVYSRLLPSMSLGRVFEFRRWSTIALHLSLRVSLFLLAVGFLDVASWALLQMVSNRQEPGIGLSAAAAVALFSVLVVAGRALIEPLQSLLAGRNQGVSRWLARRVLDIVGYAALVLCLLFWATVVQGLTFGDIGPKRWNELDPLLRWLVVCAVLVFWWLLTGSDRDLANATSLHHFYRARLTRAYVSTGNRRRFRAALWDTANETAIASTKRFSEVMSDDDVPIEHYTPEAHGGPIHLINVCINQTRDEEQREPLNSDRKGLAMTVSARGFEYGADGFVPVKGAPGLSVGEKARLDATSVGQWIAISGAAVAGGRGAGTSKGSAMLMYLLGVRLGYWWPSPLPSKGAGARGWWDRLAWSWLGKALMLKSEARADFRGTTGAAWYLSDGGHYENTGVYPLLKRRLGFILLVDCGADPQYEFGDLAELVLKARVDFGATIEFYEADEARQFMHLPVSQLTILSPEQLADNQSMRGVLLARITYLDGSVGTLLVIKPNLHSQMGLDVQTYARRNPGFPQQATSDQFFDEAQWESYHQLGLDIAGELSNSWLQQLPGWSANFKHRLTHPAQLRKNSAAAALSVGAGPTEKAPRWRGAVAGAAVGTTLGVGASVSLLAPIWTALEQLTQSRQSPAKEAEVLFSELASEWAKSREATFDNLTWQWRLNRLVISRSTLPDQLELSKSIDKLLAQVEAACSRKNLDDQGACPVRRELASLTLYYWNKPGSPILDRVRAAWRGDAMLASEMATSAAVASAGMNAAQQTVQSAPGQTTAAAKPVDSQTPADPVLCPTVTKGNERAQLVYWQVYGEADRAVARDAIALLAERGINLKSPGVENVVASAERAGRRTPNVWKHWTLIYHDANSGACATEIAKNLAPFVLQHQDRSSAIKIQPLPSTLKPSPGVIEIWIPPGGSGSTGGGF